jgi:predicted RNase H-like nuclease
MRAVLGIDAAWTVSQPSGVALALERSDIWHLSAVASSYQRFYALADRALTGEQRPSGSLPDVPKLLASASALCGARVNLVAIDIPLARTPIAGRRASDNAVSRVYGRRKAGTHTPSAQRPGPLSEHLRQGFELSGYPLLTTTLGSVGLIEVYPHPALIELAGARKRLPYKASKVRDYWPALSRSERRARLYRQWSEIINLLEEHLSDVTGALPRLDIDAHSIELKACEDALDAIVCAWVGICALEGRATPFGDGNSAIWIPSPPALAASREAGNPVLTALRRS